MAPGVQGPELGLGRRRGTEEGGGVGAHGVSSPATQTPLLTSLPRQRLGSDGKASCGQQARKDRKRGRGEAATPGRGGGGALAQAVQISPPLPPPPPLLGPKPKQLIWIKTKQPDPSGSFKDFPTTVWGRAVSGLGLGHGQGRYQGEIQGPRGRGRAATAAVRGTAGGGMGTVTVFRGLSLT